MSIVINDLSLDVSKEKRVRPQTAKQYDINSRFLRVRITNEGAPVAVDSDAYVIINAARSDGKSKSFRGIVNDDGTVTVPVTGWMLESKDFIMCDISVIDGDTGSKLSTMSFEIDVEKASASNKCIQKDEKYDILVSLISDCKQAKDDCEEATVEAKAATEKANTAADEAIKAKTETETATKNANDAAQGANTAAKNATDAASAALTAKQDAATAAERANASATSADTAATAANTAKQDADAAANNANTAAKSANDAASAALTSKQEADTAAGKASTAAAGASAAADRANNSADRANNSADRAGEAAGAANAASESAIEATNLASAAAGRANSAAEYAEQFKELLDNKQDKLKGEVGQIVSFDENGNAVAMDFVVLDRSWEKISKIVKAGFGRDFFPVGYEFTVHNSDYDYDMIWRVVGHDHHQAANDSLEHTMTLEMKNVLSNSSGSGLLLQYDAPEALYYAKDGLAAGTYNFTWKYETGSVISGSYQFSLTQPVPAGGQIVINIAGSGNPITSRKISTYASIGASDPIESDITVTEGTDGENLGTMQAYASTSENLNCAARVMSGSNNYAQSAIDELLNSSAATGEVWTPKTIFDRQPTWAATQNGFMHGLPEDFLAVVQPAIIPCRTNSVFEINSVDGTEFAVNQTYKLTRKLFLLSRPEVFNTYDSSTVRDGEVLEYYDGLTSTEHIHRDAGGMARVAWLRSPLSATASAARNVYEDGTMNSGTARAVHGIAAACIIA